MIRKATSLFKGFRRSLLCLRMICHGPPVAINGIGRIGKHLLREAIKNGTNVSTFYN